MKNNENRGTNFDQQLGANLNCAAASFPVKSMFLGSAGFFNGLSLVDDPPPSLHRYGMIREIRSRVY